MKVKIVEIDVAKLDPNATYLIVFHSIFLTRPNMENIVRQMDKLKIKAIYTESVDPANALKVYQIPKGKK